MEIKTNIKISEKEQQAYIDYVQAKNPKLEIEYLKITIEGDEVDLMWKFKGVPFERIRRITGYLVGDMGHWNDGKSAEEKDRVKHSAEMEQL